MLSEWFVGKQLLNDNQVRKSHAEKATEGQPVGLIMLLARFVEEKSCKDRRERLLHWKAGRSQEGSGCHGDWVRLTLAHKGQCQHSPPEKPRQELIYTDSASWSLPQQRVSGMLITHQFEPITTNILWKVPAGLCYNRGFLGIKRLGLIFQFFTHSCNCDVPTGRSDWWLAAPNLLQCWRYDIKTMLWEHFYLCLGVAGLSTQQKSIQSYSVM